MKIKRTDVFTPTKLPTVTYIADHLRDKETTLRRALDMGGAVITLSGPSKSGKTVFVETVIGKDNLIQVTGAGIGHADTLWKRVFDKIGTPIPASMSTSASGEHGAGGKLQIGVPNVLAVEANAATKTGTSSSATSSTTPDFLNLLVREFANTGFVIFIDDFHYIPEPVQGEIATLIKEAVRQGVLFVCAAVPYHADDVILANADLRGRMVKLDFDYWRQGELKKIAARGFSALNVEVPDSLIDALSTEAAGSPQLMQALCLNLCYEFDIDEVQEGPGLQLPSNLDAIGKICSMTSLMNDYSTIINSMEEGPKTRGEKRKTHILTDGSQVDVYPLILRAIALNPPELTIRYANLLNRIQAMCQTDAPSGSSVTGACAHMTEIANGAAGTVIVEWDGENDVLDIRDPYLLFALRWSPAGD